MKTALAILLSTLSIAFLSAQDLEQGLVLKYDLDGNYQDDSPNEFHGTGDTDFGEDRFGNPSGCALFNGTTHFIDLPNEEEIELQYPLTIAFWFNTESELATDNVMVTTDYALNNHSGVWMNMSSARKISISIGDATGSTSSTDRRTKTGETTIETNTWYHAVGIVRGPNDMDLYLNCENDGGSYVGTGQGLNYTDAPGSIGRKDIANVAPYYFDGKIDDMRFWNRELTIEEIQLLCAQDECDTDTTAPEFSSFPVDFSLSCSDELPEIEEITATDDGEDITVSFIEEIEDLECGTRIIRTWTAEDFCGNLAETVQTIDLIDDAAPTLVSGQESVFLSGPDLILQPPVFEDECNDVVLDYVVNESGSTCFPTNPQDGLAYVVSFALMLHGENGPEYYDLSEVSTSAIELGSTEDIFINCTFTSQDNPANGYYAEIHLGQGMDWDAWSAQQPARSYKEDFDNIEDEYLNWNYFILDDASFLEGFGPDLEGSVIELTHAPSNLYYGFQLGDKANTFTNNVGLGGWFGWQSNDGGSGHGDFIFDLNCTPSTYTVNWTASDCAGNTADFSQTYSSTFAGIMAASCTADLNFDHAVNVQDQLKLLSRYGKHSFLGVADMNRDRQVNVDDLMQFLAGYGVMCE